MNHELKRIKKLYGEKFSHLCRDLFSTILDHDGILFEILNETFAPTHFLYNDLIENNLINEFKNYIYNLYQNKLCIMDKTKEKIKATPEELMESVGYILKECTTEEEIEEYKKYYIKDEELCTFKRKRLNDCRVFFAVKKNALDIKREDFKNPKRQDEYGVSVISIQFTKDATNTLSIKNRYNHTVENPDATFSNNLDNIIPGLTESFENTYGIIQKYKNNNFEIPGYVRANDGRVYKFNYEIYNIYYCTNNIIIDNSEVKKYDKEKYIIFDYFILDLVNKKIITYDQLMKDSFLNDFQNISKIEVLKENNNKRIILTPEKGDKIQILINEYNQMIEYENNNITHIKDFYLVYNTTLTKYTSLNLVMIDDEFMLGNKDLKIINCSSLEFIGSDFLKNNEELEDANFPNVSVIGDNFLQCNKKIKHFVSPKLVKVGYNFLEYNLVLEYLELPSLEEIAFWFLGENKCLKQFIADNLQEIGIGFLNSNESLEVIKCSKLDKGYVNNMNSHVYETFYNNNLVGKMLIKLYKI